MKHSKSPELMLAVHPTSRGFGWVLFEGPLVPVDWGIASAKGKRSAQGMVRFKQLIDQYRPSVLVLEKYEEDDSNRGERIRTIAQTMRGFANNHDMDTPIYGGEEVRIAVTGNPKASRHTSPARWRSGYPFCGIDCRRPESFGSRKTLDSVSSMLPLSVLRTTS